MPSTTPSRWALAVFAVAAGALGIATAWALATSLFGGMQGWLGFVAAADAALLLRLAGVAPGRARMLAAVVATAATVALAGWFSVAADLAPLFGLRPLDAVLRLGPDTAVLMVRQAASVADWAWIGLSLPFAGWLGR